MSARHARVAAPCLSTPLDWTRPWTRAAAAERSACQPTVTPMRAFSRLRPKAAGLTTGVPRPIGRYPREVSSRTSRNDRVRPQTVSPAIRTHTPPWHRIPPSLRCM